MKKIVMIWMVVVLVLMNVNGIMANDDLKVNVNGVEVDFPDAQPFIDENNRTLVPIRFIAEQLGATVEWYQETQTATVELYGTILSIVIGEKKVSRNNQATIYMDTRAIIKDNRTYVPLRFVAEGLGARVAWDNPTRTAYVALYGPPTVDETVEVEDEEVKIEVEIEESGDWFVYLDLTLDIETQWNQTRAFLMERLDKVVVDEIMKYIMLKKSTKDGLPKKLETWVLDNNLILDIGGVMNDPIIQISAYTKTW